MSELVVLVPVKGRPHRVRPTLDGFAPHRVLFIPDPDDKGEIEALEREQAEFFAHSGNYAAKINEGVRRTTEPLILLAADDLKSHPGWFGAAKDRLNTKIGVVATADLCNPRTMAGNLATHPLVARWYIDRHGTIDEPGKVLHEGYAHEFCDQELTETAKHRGAFDFAPDSVLEHCHPDVGKAPMDPLYAARPGRMKQGRKLYRKRRKLWR